MKLRGLAVSDVAIRPRIRPSFHYRSTVLNVENVEQFPCTFPWFVFTLSTPQKLCRHVARPREPEILLFLNTKRSGLRGYLGIGVE